MQAKNRIITDYLQAMDTEGKAINKNKVVGFQTLTQQIPDLLIHMNELTENQRCQTILSDSDTALIC